MIGTLRSYPQYKQSGSPWMGQIPGHWEVRRLGSVLRERRETNEQREVAAVLSVLKHVGVIPYEDKGNIGNKKSDDISRYKVVRPDDIVVNCMNVIIGSVGRSRYTGCLSPVYYVLTKRSDHDNPRYLSAVFETKPFYESLVRIGNGILAHRMRVPMELLKCEPFPVPPSDEQDAIVRFLDWATGRLDRAIRNKRKLIALLNEQKQAIIHQAITRGLDPNVPLKPSGIHWVGDIPTHWEVIKFARVISHGPQNGISPAIDENGSIESFSISAIRGGRVEIRDSDRKYILANSRLNDATYNLLRGDILIVRGNGNIGLVGKAGVVEHDMSGRVYPDLLMRVRVSNRVVPAFIVMLLNGPTIRTQVESAARTAVGTFKINNQQVRQFWVALPPFAEQQHIVEWILQSTRTVGIAEAQAAREMELLTEYRTRLLADLVTGKFDVRGIEIPTEEVAEPAESLDSAEIESEEDELVEEYADAD